MNKVVDVPDTSEVLFTSLKLFRKYRTFNQVDITVEKHRIATLPAFKEQF